MLVLIKDSITILSGFTPRTNEGLEVNKADYVLSL